MSEAATPATRRGELTPISRTATVLLVLFSAWMWVEAVGFLAVLVPAVEAPGWLAALAEGFRSYWWLAVPVIGLLAAWLIRSGLRRDRFRRAAIVASVSFVLTVAVAAVSIWLSVASLVAMLDAVGGIGGL